VNKTISVISAICMYRLPFMNAKECTMVPVRLPRTFHSMAGTTCRLVATSGLQATMFLLTCSRETCIIKSRSSRNNYRSRKNSKPNSREKHGVRATYGAARALRAERSRSRVRRIRFVARLFAAP
jgi:hypothetical protein